jgi:hypothetical protein
MRKLSCAAQYQIMAFANTDLQVLRPTYQIGSPGRRGFPVWGSKIGFSSKGGWYAGLDGEFTLFWGL